MEKNKTSLVPRKTWKQHSENSLSNHTLVCTTVTGNQHWISYVPSSFFAHF